VPGIILSPDLLGIEGQTHEATASVVKINGVELSENAIRSITSLGWSKEGVNNNFALGNRHLVSYTSGVIVPRDISIILYSAMAEVIKGIISPTGKWAVSKFNITVQLDAPSSAFPGVAGLLSLPVLTTTINGCEIIGTDTGIEAAGGAIVDTWTVKPLKIRSPSGLGT
jgi:hypothetical protein